MSQLRIGTCSWKYGSWKDLVYSESKGINFLEEYARRYDTVEIDQWFWSLFEGNDPVLPKSRDVDEYLKAVPESFRFSIKVPNSVTLTHYYNKSKTAPLEPNGYFLSAELFGRFLTRLEPLKPLIGALMFQFEYLNRKKMPSQQQFQGLFSEFLTRIPGDYPYAIEIRNPNYLNAAFFAFLQQNRLSPVLLQGYYMPSIISLFNKWRCLILDHDSVVVRLHGPNRQRIEKKAGGDWSRIIEPKNQELEEIAALIHDLQDAKVRVYLNVNNHYEGCAPLTIRRLEPLLEGRGGA